MRAVHLTHWSTAFKPKNNSQIVLASNHDEQNGAPERRSRANLQLKIFRRRPVTVNVIRLKTMSLAIEAFIENARVFCNWLESDRHDILAVRQTLLALLQGVPSLIVNGADDIDTDAVPRRDHDAWSADVARLSDLPLQYYRVAFDPLALETESTVVGDVCDDLADIYGELWHGLQALDSGATIYAVRHWHDSYRYHWGLHATGALFAIDAYLRSQDGG
jgi:hypothetical protein